MAEDMFKLQQDAIRRAKEVYSRSGNHNVTRPGPLPQKNPPPAVNLPAEAKDILSTLFQDKDKTLILSLLLLLADEGCDNNLLFTLIYLLM